jgi:Fic family protein
VVKSTQPKSATRYLETAFGILPRRKIIPLEQEGVKRAQHYIIKLSEEKTKITPQVILDVHAEGFSSIFPDWAGKYRTVDVTVGDYEPPHYSQLPVLIKNLCDDLEERLRHLPSLENDEQFLAELISILAWFQHHLVWIHPFRDYNGRIARLLTNLLLLNLGFPLASIKAETGKDRSEYVDSMKAADNHDYSKLEKLLASALKEGLKNI